MRAPCPPGHWKRWSDEEQSPSYSASCGGRSRALHVHVHMRVAGCGRVLSVCWAQQTGVPHVCMRAFARLLRWRVSGRRCDLLDWNEALSESVNKWMGELFIGAYVSQGIALTLFGACSWRVCACAWCCVFSCVRSHVYVRIVSVGLCLCLGRVADVVARHRGTAPRVWWWGGQQGAHLTRRRRAVMASSQSVSLQYWQAAQAKRPSPVRRRCPRRRQHGGEERAGSDCARAPQAKAYLWAGAPRAACCCCLVP